MAFSLDNKVVLIVGASSGIGEGIARKIASSAPSVRLLLGARRVDRLDKILEDLKANLNLNPASKAFSLDVSKRDNVQAVYKSIDEEFGGVDVVVNVAGVMYFQLLKNGHWDQWEQQIDVNCKGTVYSCGAALNSMLTAIKAAKEADPKAASPGKHIVNISSDAAKQTFPALTIYNASKTFVKEYTKGLRCECVGTGIRVTDIQPGDVRTELIVNNSDQEAAKKIGVDIGKKIGGEDFDESTRASYLDPEDIANAVLYAVTAPAHVGVHEILIEPRDQMFGDPTSLDVLS